MRFEKKANKTVVPFLPLFVGSIVVMMFLTFFQKSELLLHTEVLNKEHLSLLKYQTGNNSLLFLCIVRERIWVIPFLFLMSTTYLASVTVYGILIRYGAGIGALLAIAVMRYGGRGIILLLGATVPHFLFYVPAIMIALRVSQQKREVNRRFFAQLIILELVVIIGCTLECYVNLLLIEKIIKFFIIR